MSENEPALKVARLLTGALRVGRSRVQELTREGLETLVGNERLVGIDVTGVFMRIMRGVLLLSAIVVAGCATTPMQPPTVNVTGEWSGTWAYGRPSLGQGTLRGTLTPNGERLAGSFSLAGGGGRLFGPRVVTVIGTVSGNEITLSQPSLGTLTVTSNEISGVVRGLDDARVTLQRQ